MPLPKSRKKLLNLFSQIEDESIRRIISEVISLESEHRSLSAINFPRRKVEDIIDSEARFIESKRGEGEDEQ